MSPTLVSIVFHASATLATDEAEESDSNPIPTTTAPTDNIMAITIPMARS